MYSLVLLTMLTLGAHPPVLLAQAPADDNVSELLAEPKAAPGEGAKSAPVTAESAAGAPPAAATDKEKAANEKSIASAAGVDAGDVAKDGESTSAEGTETAAAGDGWLTKVMSQGAIGYMFAGGFFMWPILILGIICGGVIIERYRSLQMLQTDTAGLRAEVHTLLQEDRVEEAYRLCDSQQGPVPAILATGLRQFLVLRRLGYDPGRIEENVIKAMDDYGVHIVAAMERHLPMLATISSVAPMLGFLGTVQGMVVSFDDIVRTMGETNIVEAAAAGIKVSLLTTVLGLVVGIPAFMSFNYFTGVINRYVLDVEESATELIQVVTLQMALNSKEQEASPERVPVYEKG
jgi:biopolymer transport protein ExbB